MPIVQLKKLNFSFYDKKREALLEILKDINLEIKQGEFHLITGPSGSGKTTLIQIIGTILHQNDGLRKIFSTEISSETTIKALSKIRRQIGYLYQTPYLPPHLTVNKYIELQSALSGIDLDKADERAMMLIEKFEIGAFKNSLPIKLSGGEKQRIALAGILAKDIKLLLLDEPTGSLDFENKLMIWELLKQLKDEKLTIIVVSHDESIIPYVDFQHKLEAGYLI
ncbi:MAG: ATP-binding cassette domain-containing protein [Candidatus Heimdallarchaeota archaeon]|nr:ATP-binding cassette domain-containing protein [Candidatus Heimdallarchaeota archaeon]